MTRPNGGKRVAAVLGVLVVLHFGLRPWLGNPRLAPDFLLLALLVYAIRARPGRAAVVGYLVGLLSDSLNPIAFGSAMLAYSVVGFLAAWGKAVFFAENRLVAAAFFFGGVCVRDVLVLLWGGHAGGTSIAWQLGLWTPLQGLTTAVVGVAVQAVLQGWLRVRGTG
jgi:rod shape-determining protein MreD